MIGHAARVRISGDVVFRELEGEMVLLNLRTGVYFGLDPVATTIWRLLEARRTVGEIVEALVREYDATPAQIEEDVRRLVAALGENALLEPDDSATG